MRNTDCKYVHVHHHPLNKNTHEHDSHDEHHHDHLPNDKKLLSISFFITFIVMFVEIIGGFYANSLALVSDAIHMFTHSFALGLSLFALSIASREANEVKSFGYYRAEVIVAFINGLTIALSVLWIVYEAVFRFLNPQEILTQTTFVIALIGLIVNIITGILLFRANQDNINIRSAFLHMMSDTLSSVAIIIGTVIIYYTQLYIVDTILALFVAAIIAKWAYGLIVNSIHILLEGSPVDVNKVKSAILEDFMDIIDIHDIHCWEISRNNYYFTAHIVVDSCNYESYEAMINLLSKYLQDNFNIGHTTLQFETK
ncbi:MAG: Cation transporter [Campylobacterota bacterium]|nr:Cation transporter [Campylobacterota bacterium]